MKRFILIVSVLLCSFIPISMQAQDPFLELVKGATKKIIKAVDLMVQRLQNKTIWLQNAQKTIENTLSKLKLDEISEWVEKHKEQYAQYYDELKRVKQIISGYHEVKILIRRQVLILEEYKQALRLFKGDNHFSSVEIRYMEDVFIGILDESIKNLDMVMKATRGYILQMTDGERLNEIHLASNAIEKNLQDLRSFIASNKMTSLKRAIDLDEINRIKIYYGIQ